MRLLIALTFAAILMPLSLRMALPFVDLPDFLAPFESVLTSWTDLLAAPFVALGAGNTVREYLPPVGSFGRLEPNIVAAFAGWSIVEAIIIGIIGLFRHRPES